MEQLIDDVYAIIKDYRVYEGADHLKITKDRIKRWINQFEENDREFLLTELKAIFKQHYCSMDEARQFLKQIVEKLSQDYGYAEVRLFLKDTIFMDLQPNGKSQKKMLELLRYVLKDDFSFEFSDCGSSQKRNFVYVDDVLCTGKTMLDDINEWCNSKYDDSKTHLEALKKSEIRLVFAYVFIHLKNYYKKRAEFGHKIDTFLKNNHKMYSLVRINNTDRADSDLSFVLPLEQNQPNLVVDYKNKIIEQVDEYTDRMRYRRSEDEFYRPEGRPIKETLFTSYDNRARFENIILKKGIDILQRSNSNINNMRALGYSLPSQKNFGFGTLCFTWRNVPNNVPLTFWYDAGGNFPLFVVRRGGNNFE